MNRERAKELLPIITAYANGEIIEFRGCSASTWAGSPTSIYTFDAPGEYRIKPKEYWVNVYKYDGSNAIPFAGTIVYGSREEAERSGKSNNIKCIRSVNIGE